MANTTTQSAQRENNPNLITETEQFIRSNIKIPSATPEWQLDAWRYLPKGRRTPCPVIVMAHGLGATKRAGLAGYAQAFAFAGYGCVVFDYRRWGDSDGTPRQCVNLAEQLQDYRTVIKHCRQQPEFDPQRLIIWGTSFSGGHCAVLATEKELNIRAVISQCPCLDLLKQAVGLSPTYVPLVAEPGEIGVLTTPGCITGTTYLYYDQHDFINEINASCILVPASHRAVDHAENVSCPILLLPAVNDNIALHEGVVEFAKKCPQAEVAPIDSGHFDIYPLGPRFKEALDKEVAFIQKTVPV